MVGTKSGGLKTALKNKEIHGENFYRVIGSIGGRKSRNGGFAANPELAKIAGKKGGQKSSRKGIKNGEGKKKVYFEDERVNYQSY